ncbi:MAG: hypothetical protein H7146_10600 [Burkholderiaceae bacterium]|nr:hypothetical protein [Microbacteriaceae bacterium]
MSTPSRRERFRPLELLSLSGVVAVFVGLIVLMSTRQLNLCFIFGGVSFILALLTLAMLSLTSKATDQELRDIDGQNLTQPKNDSSGH